MNRRLSWLTILTTLSVILLISPDSAPGADRDTTGFAQFVGDWRGEGHFYNVDLNSTLGHVLFTLRVSSDLEVSGVVGQAEITDASIERDEWNQGYRIRGSIRGDIFPGEELQKKRITLLLKGVKDYTIEGDFHLANNEVFDFSMRPGALRLRKE